MTRWHIIQGDLRAGALEALEPESFHAVLCDPPYGLSPDGRARTWDDAPTGRGFMGKAWDAAVPGPTFWRSVLRVLRPGAHVLAFGGTRTYHRTAGALEDAGFELRDMLAYLYGSGFPKSLDVSKAIDRAAGELPPEGVGFTVAGTSHNPKLLTTAPSAGYVRPPAVTDDAKRWLGYGTALKPAQEPIALARKPLDGTVAANCLEHGCGGLAIDAGRIEGPASVGGVAGDGMGYHGADGVRRIDRSMSAGRWPANVLLDEAAAAMLDEQSGAAGQQGSASFGSMGYHGGGSGSIRAARGDTGGASRFFKVCKGDGECSNPTTTETSAVLGVSGSRFIYTAKASRREREAGCEGLQARSAGEIAGRAESSPGLVNSRAGAVAAKSGGARNHHPTVKPLSLTTYLARLLLPPPGPSPRRILVPFSGSGSEMIGCLLAGWDEVVGVEMEAEYVAIAQARIAHWCPDELTLQVAE